MRGIKPWTVDELERVAELIGVPVMNLIAREWALWDSNPQPTDYGRAVDDSGAVVLPFPVERVA